MIPAWKKRREKFFRRLEEKLIRIHKKRTIIDQLKIDKEKINHELCDVIFYLGKRVCPLLVFLPCLGLCILVKHLVDP